jgi:hypothetical protein
MTTVFLTTRIELGIPMSYDDHHEIKSSWEE